MFIHHKIRTLISDLQLEQKKIRVQDIADSIGIAKKSLENYRDGSSYPTVEVLERIAIYFGKDMNYFFDSMPKGLEIGHQVVSSPVEVYEPPSDLAKCYKIMFEQQKEITELTREVEHLKNGHAPMNGAQAG